MKHVLVSFVVIAALVACGKKDDKKGAGGGSATAGAKATADDCDKLGAKSSVQSMERTLPGATDEQRAKLQALSDEAGKVIAKHCKDDGWTAEAVVCGLRAQNPQVECNDKLTAEQKQTMTADVQAIFAKAMAAGPTPTPTPTPPAPSLTLPEGTPPPSAPPATPPAATTP